MDLPEGVHGVVLREKPCPEAVREENEDVTSFWAAETSFRNVTVRKQEATCPTTRSLARSLLVVLFCCLSQTGVSSKRRAYARSRRRRIHARDETLMRRPRTFSFQFVFFLRHEEKASVVSPASMQRTPCTSRLFAISLILSPVVPPPRASPLFLRTRCGATIKFEGRAPWTEDWRG